MFHLAAARAGASKETLCRHFGNKEELFADIVRRRSARITGSPREILSGLGRNLSDFLPLGDSLSFCRIVFSEAIRVPEFGRIFLRARTGPLARYLCRATGRGELRCLEPS
jgi:TetR/AcrR family transcriptional regulator, mexJK operon transcriptional repressor